MAQHYTGSCNTLVERGKLKFYSKDVLQQTSSYVVYSGLYEGTIPVAIKRLKKTEWNLEFIKRHREFDRHENIARYYVTEEDGDFYYIGIELWAATLEDLIRGRCKGPPVGSDKEILLQIAKAVEYLSNRGLVHRNITPETILISGPDGRNPPRIKLFDFSVSRKMESEQRDLENSGQIKDNNWSAPELLGPKERYSTAADVFSAGCVFAYFLSGGKHPFGGPSLQMLNTVSNKIEWPDEITDETAKDLITNMLKFDAKDRISINDVLSHPYFWDEAKSLRFIDAVVGLVEPQVPLKGSLYQALELAKSDVFSGCWPDELSENAKRNIFEGKHPMKRTDEVQTSFFHLLKALRNKWKHFSDLEKDVQDEYGCSVQDYYNYWTNRFPKWLISVWKSMKPHEEQPILRRFYT